MSSTMSSTTRWTIICDFDGTIAPIDVTDRLLQRHAGSEWTKIEAAWQRNEISSRQCLIRQAELLSMTAADLADSIADVNIDKDFVDFVTFAQARRCKVMVASEGYAQVIRSLLRRAETPDLPIAATHLIPNGAARWMIGTPFASDTCASDAATCKCAVARQGAAVDAPLLVIGDGRSDFCVASQADFVFARGALLQHCLVHSLPHAVVKDFKEARRQLEILLGASPMPVLRFATPALEQIHG